MIELLSKELIVTLFVLLAWGIKELVSYWRKKRSKATKEALAHAEIIKELVDVKKEQVLQRQLVKHSLRFSDMLGTKMVQVDGANGDFKDNFQKFQDDTRDELMD